MRNSGSYAGLTCFLGCDITVEIYDVIMADRKYVVTTKRADKPVRKQHVGKLTTIWDTEVTISIVEESVVKTCKDVAQDRAGKSYFGKFSVD